VTSAVIGGGVQGCLAAIELSGRGHQVVLFEGTERLATRASRWNEGKIHLGYLFANDPSLRTARTLIDGATSFAPLLRRYLESDLSTIARSPGFAYAVHRESLLSPEIVGRHLATVHELIDEALAGKERDYLGAARLRPPRRTPQAMDGLDESGVLAAFATDEQSINSPELCELVAARAKADAQIEIVTGLSIAAVVRDDRDRFLLRDATGRDHGPFENVVNATWEQRLALDSTIGHLPERSWVHRFKLGLYVSVAPGVEDLPSVTFVLGPFGDIVNFGRGRLYLSWYPVGRIGVSTELAPPGFEAEVAVARRDGLPARIVEPLATLIPGLRRLDLAKASWELNGGHIFAWGASDIDDMTSGLHSRYQIGVHSDRGYHSIDTGKLTMAPRNADVLGRRIGPPGVRLASSPAR
jgi:glycine/D-amino acid oxidase-like deaminating enzyme